MGDPTAGEVGGVFAGLTALLALIGGGLRWLLGYRERRDQTRAEKLQLWHDELAAREAKLDAQMAAQLAETQRQFDELKARDEQRAREHAALHTAYQLITAALRNLDQANPALRMADELLRLAFPPDPVTPGEMGNLVARLDAADTKGTRA